MCAQVSCLMRPAVCWQVRGRMAQACGWCTKFWCSMYVCCRAVPIPSPLPRPHTPSILHPASTCADGAHVPGLYVCGWLKRGPTGIIGTNLTDAEETVAALAADRAAGAPRWVTHGGVGGRPFLRTLLSQRCVPVVDLAAWKRLDDVEVAAGIAAGGVPRIKVVEPMAALAAAGVSSAVQHGTATRPV